MKTQARSRQIDTAPVRGRWYRRTQPRQRHAHHASSPIRTRPAEYGIVNRHVDACHLRHPHRERAAQSRTEPQTTGYAAAARRLQRPPGGRRRLPPTVRARHAARSPRPCCPAPTRQRLRRLEAAPNSGRVLRRRACRATDRPASQHHPNVGRRGNGSRAHRSVGPTRVHLAPARCCTAPRQLRLRPPNPQDQPMGREELTPYGATERPRFANRRNRVSASGCCRSSLRECPTLCASSYSRPLAG